MASLKIRILKPIGRQHFWQIITEFIIFMLPLVALILFVWLYLHPQLENLRETEKALTETRNRIFSLEDKKEKASQPAELESRIERLEKDRDNHMADIRQETNNVIEKTNLLLTFWLAVLAIFCGFLPILIQYRLYIVNRDKLEQELSYYRDFLRTHSIHHIAGNISMLSELKIISDTTVRDMAMDKFIYEAADIFEEIVDSASKCPNGILPPEMINNLIRTLIQILAISNNLGKHIGRYHRREYSEIHNNIKKELIELINIDSERTRIKTKSLIQRLYHLSNSIRALSRCIA